MVCRVSNRRVRWRRDCGRTDRPDNVETFANVPEIILKGWEWYRSIGTEGSPGTKTFSLTGAIENTGLIEVPMGTTLREIIFDIGGGRRTVQSLRLCRLADRQADV